MIHAESLGYTRDADNVRRKKAEARPQRTCLACPASLSMYNPNQICGPCERKQWEAQADRPEEPIWYTKTCTWCHAVYRSTVRRRRICYQCISVESVVE